MKTKAQQRAIERMTKKLGVTVVMGVEPDGVSLRVRYEGQEPEDDRTRVITPSGLVLEPVA